MARLKRSELYRSIKGCWRALLEAAVEASGGREGGVNDLHTFAPRKYIGNQRWRIPDYDDQEAIEEMKLRGLWDKDLMQIRIDTMKFANAYYLSFDGSRREYHNFGTIGEAAAFLERVIDKHKTKWIDNEKLYIKAIDLTVTSIRLEDIAEAEPEELTTPNTIYADRLSGKDTSLAARLGLPADTTPTGRRAYSHGPNTQSINPKTPEVRAMREAMPLGDITPADVADRLKLEPREVRNVLRKKGVPKPYRWADIDPILALFK